MNRYRDERHRDERHRHGEHAQDRHDRDRHRHAAADDYGGPHGGAGPRRGFEEERNRPGYYSQRPYAERPAEYDYDPRGPGEYSYSGARGSMVSPGWDRWRGDMPEDAHHGEFGHGDYDQPAYGRESGYAARTTGFGRGGPRYAGADYGRGFQTPGRDHYDSDDFASRQRMRQWSGDRGSNPDAAYSPYGGGGRRDEGRSGYRSSWGASDAQMATGTSWRGHGPQGYARSDQRINEDICERLTDDPDVDPREVSVQVQEGVVTLEGRVDDRWMKHHIEDLVDATHGVTDIHNRIRVGPRVSEPGAGGDTLRAGASGKRGARH